MAQCIATVKRTGNQCRQDAIHGATVCRMHGGGAPQVKAGAKRRLAKVALEGEVGRLLEQMGSDPVPDLIDGLLIAVEHCARMVAAYRIVAGRRGVLGVNRHGEEVPDPGVVEYRNWLDEWAKLTKLALDAGIDERRTKLSELDSANLFHAIGDAIDAAGLTDEQHDAFRTTLAARLRAIESP